MQRLVAALKVPVDERKKDSSEEFKKKMVKELAGMMIQMFNECDRKRQTHKKSDGNETESEKK